jgi:competence protein ComEA
MMKTWQHILLGFLFGIICAGVITLGVVPPRGVPIQLLPAPTPQPITVYVTGCIKSPGLYQLSNGSRVVNAMEIAGGNCQSANLEGINLAAKLSDGMQVDIPFEGNQSSTHPIVDENNLTENDTNMKEASININTASWEVIETLPGIGPEKAKQIVKYRQETGSFLTLEDLLNVPGIGTTIFNQIKPFLTLE